jgi:hypothetical protein
MKNRTWLSHGAALACLLAAVLPSVTQAQADPSEVKLRNDCRLAAQVIRTGTPAPKAEWALVKISQCTPALQAEVLAQKIDELRTSTDRHLVGNYYGEAKWFQDGRLFAVLLDVASDRGAAAEARIMAFTVLAGIASPYRVIRYAEFASGLNERGQPRAECASRQQSHALTSRPVQTPLPNDFREQLNRVSRRVFADSTEPPTVRSAAGCS